ncbi:hypothetical protein ACIGEZ_04955 [Streptomyces sp. NPDC085481]|uniref:hypothetical protein n=1 Tax=Streptomyces sp. NPDC085481 TaxID=3365727 RepID=UPI0037D2EEC7
MPAPSPADIAAAETITAAAVTDGGTDAPVPAAAARTPAARGRRRATGPAGPGAHGASGRSGVSGRSGASGGPGQDAASDVVRWAVFCCALVPVVLVVYGTSLGGAAGTALGLAAVTAACRVLLRHSERGLRAERTRPRTGRGYPPS